METKRKYYEWAEHPRWNELCEICRNMDNLKQKATRLRELIQKEVYSDNTQEMENKYIKCKECGNPAQWVELGEPEGSLYSCECGAEYNKDGFELSEENTKSKGDKAKGDENGI